MRNNQKLIIIIISIILVLVIAGGIFAYLYLKTDMFKSNQELFGKYITQTVEQFQKLTDLQTIKEYQQLENESKYESNTNIKIVSSEGGEISNPFNKLTAKLGIQKDDENQYLYGNGQILFEDEKYLEAEIIKEQGVYGIRLPDVVKQFVTVKDDENIEAVADNIGIEVSTLKEIINFIDGNNTIISNESTEENVSKYSNILMQELQKGTFAKQKDAMITYNNLTTKTNAYEVSLTSEQVKNILIECLNNLKNETELLEKISIVTEDIDEVIEEINSSEEIPTLKITVFEQQQNTIRTILEIERYKITIDNINENGIIKNIIKLVDLNSEDGKEYDIEITRNNTENQENFEITISIIENGETYTISFILQTNMSDTTKEFKSTINYEQGIKLVSLEITNTTNIGTDFEKMGIVGTNENMLLNDLDEVKREYVINFLNEKVPEKVNEQTILLIGKLGLQNNETEQNTQENGEQENIEDDNSQVEINKFNAKFEFYTGDEVSATNVKQLLQVVKENLESYEMTQNEENGKNIIKLKIKENTKNEEQINQVMEKIEDNNRYKVSISYSNINGLIEYITISEN